MAIDFNACFTTSRLSFPLRGEMIEPGSVVALEREGDEFIAQQAVGSRGEFRVGMAWHSSTDLVSVLMGHNVVPTDRFDASRAYEPGDPLFVDGYGMLTTEETPGGPFAMVIFSPRLGYPYLTVEFQTGVFYRPLVGGPR